MTTSNYICDLCNKMFNQKIDFTRHKNKKSPCVSIDKIQELTLKKSSNQENKSNITTIFKYCLDVLRDSEHLIGDKALRNLAFLLDLRLLEKQFNDKIIDIDSYDYDFSSYECSNEQFNEEHKKKLLGFTRFSNLVKENENNLYTIMKYLWDDILSVHPTTKYIFLKDKSFDIQNQSTYKKLIDKLYSFKFEDIEADILGEAYEQVISDIMTGKVLGQFFTPPKVKQMIVNLLNPQLKEDGTIETIFDPAMGTGGFLITSIRHIMKQSKLKNINIDWNFISQYGLGGREAESDTYQLAISNMLISTGHMFDILEKGDSIRDPITKKYDIILANPPFGIDGLNYLEIKHELRNEYLPIKSNSAVPLFLQAIIYMLKINGRCAVVLPDGKELFSKYNELIAIREYLMKTCDLKEIIYLPSGIFTHTSIKTCVFYFIKRKESSEILETKVKYSKVDNKEIERKNIFSKTHQTSKVKFYDYNPYEDIKNLLVEVDIKKIVENSYSLNYQEYLEDKDDNEEYNDVENKLLSDIFKLNGNGKTNSKDISNTGEYPFYKASCNNPSGIHKTYDFDGKEYLLIVKSGGSSSKPISSNYGIGKVFLVNGKCAANIAVFQLLPKTNDNIKYLYYFLLFNQHKIQELANYCTNNGNIDMQKLMKMKIQIPIIEKQEEIVKYLDFIYEECINASNNKIIQLKQLNEYCLNNQKIFGENKIKKLGDIFVDVKTGKDVVSKDRKNGIYPFYGANGIIDYVDDYLFDGKYLLTARTGSLGSLHISNNKFWCSGDVHRMEFNNEITLLYIYYYLQTLDFQKFRTGVAHPKLSGTNLKLIKIHIPSIEKQKDIIDYCENNDNLIKQLKKEIEQNKIMAKEFISNIMKNSVTNNELVSEKEDSEKEDSEIDL